MVSKIVLKKKDRDFIYEVIAIGKAILNILFFILKALSLISLFLFLSKKYKKVLNKKAKISAITSAAIKDKHTSFKEERSLILRKITVAVILIVTSKIPEIAFLYDFPIDAKYPLITEERAIKGSSIEIASIGTIETEFFKNVVETIGDNIITRMLDKIPSINPNKRQVLNAFFTLYSFFNASSSETIQVHAVDTPDVAKVTANK